MLKTLRIRNLAIVEELNVTFGAGLNVLTGETGAGKSIVVDALALVSGDRADASMVRSGAERAIVEAELEIPQGSPVHAIARERGVDIEGGTLVVRREIAPSGGGRVLINGSPSTVAVLRRLGDCLVELHGQHEHQSLLSQSRHAELLDDLGEHGELLERVAADHADVLLKRRNLEELMARSADREAHSEQLRVIVREIDAVTPKEGELEALERERAVLRNSGTVAQLLDESVEMLYDGEVTAAALAAGAARRSAALAEIDPSLEEVHRRVESARVELEEAGAALRDYRDRTDFDPHRLESVEARRAALENLLLRYGADESAVLERRAGAAAELKSIESLDDTETRLRDAVVEAEVRYLEGAALLSRGRRAAAKRIQPRVEAELAELALPAARFEIDLKAARGEQLRQGGRRGALNPRGFESVEFLLSANTGEPARPLARIASGGELARIMLSLHVVLESAGEGRVLVFDEIDAGVSGAVADTVGVRLAALADRHQVLCVTHLPQVAAHAERHYHVAKRVVGKRTQVEVAALEGEQRVKQLAHMLGGHSVTSASTQNAAELIAAAEARKA
jgi:DNA repair protein RecN (Recombination protein N)